MQDRPFDQQNLAMPSSTLLSPALPVSGGAVPFAATSTLDTSSVDAEAEWPPESIVDTKKLGKGVCWAFAIEAAGALGIIAIWELLRRLR